MALPASKTKDELSKLSDDALLAYFSDHARYDPQAPKGSQYAIRLGSKPFFSQDTSTLFQKFKAACRA